MSEDPAPVGTLAVIGVGMIGGSVAAAARAAAAARFIVGFDPGRDSAQALALGLVDRLCDTLEAALAEADLVVLAAPVAAIVELLPAVARAAAPGTIVTDCGSTKARIARAADAAFAGRPARFVAGHPIAGGERSGPAAAQPGLFAGRRVLLCPGEAADAPATAAVEAFWQRLGARVDRIDAVRHDALFAEVSHWPHAAAFALAAAIGEGPFGEEAVRAAGAGLRDTTRIAASDPDLWTGILLDNRDAALVSARRFRDEVDRIVAAIEARDAQALREAFSRASRWRRRVLE